MLCSSNGVFITSKMAELTITIRREAVEHGQTVDKKLMNTGTFTIYEHKLTKYMNIPT